MKNKELRKLRRAELLELMLQQQTEIDSLKQENEQLIQKLNDRTITIENAGSIAEASLKLNKVFEAAQKAADDYLESIKSQSNGKTNAKRKRKKWNLTENSYSVLKFAMVRNEANAQAD